jgi:hypothetical protein
MKKICEKFQWYNIIIIAGICMFSLLCWINFAKSVGSAFNTHVKTSTDVEKEGSENDDVDISNVVEVTEVKNEDKKYLEYVDMLDSYIDNIDSMWYNAMFKKANLSRVDTLYTYFLTKEIASSQVVKGNGNWLFYKSSTDGDSIGDYEGTNRYSSSEMNNILDQALITQEVLNSRNIKLAIMVAPNKENIYSEYMPDTYTHADISSTDILIDYLAENGVNIISPKKELLDNRDEFQLYYSYDTHWNQLGAYIGVKNVLESWNISKPALANRSISSYNLAGNYHYCGGDDLAKMVGMRDSVFNDEIEYEVEGTGVMNWKEFEDEQNNNEVSYFYNADAQMKATLLLVGDSFRTAMIPSLRETFSDVYVVHRSYYTADLLDEIEPEYLIAEYVERYSSNIGKISSLVK